MDREEYHNNIEFHEKVDKTSKRVFYWLYTRFINIIIFITLYYPLWVPYSFNSSRYFNWFYNFRENSDGQLLNRSEAHMTESTTYNPKNPIKMIVHGWHGCSSEHNTGVDVHMMNNCSVCSFIVNGK